MKERWKPKSSSLSTLQIRPRSQNGLATVFQSWIRVTAKTKKFTQQLDDSSIGITSFYAKEWPGRLYSMYCWSSPLVIIITTTARCRHMIVSHWNVTSLLDRIQKPTIQSSYPSRVVCWIYFTSPPVFFFFVIFTTTAAAVAMITEAEPTTRRRTKKPQRAFCNKTLLSSVPGWWLTGMTLSHAPQV